MIRRDSLTALHVCSRVPGGNDDCLVAWLSCVHATVPLGHTYVVLHLDYKKVYCEWPCAIHTWCASVHSTKDMYINNKQRKNNRSPD